MNIRRQAAAMDCQTLCVRLPPEPTRSYAHRPMTFRPCRWSERTVLYSEWSRKLSFFNTSSSSRRSPAKLQDTTFVFPLTGQLRQLRHTDRPHGSELASLVWQGGSSARRELSRTAYGACASDGRSAGAWTERAAILRGREGVNTPASAEAQQAVEDAIASRQ